MHNKYPIIKKLLPMLVISFIFFIEVAPLHAVIPNSAANDLPTVISETIPSVVAISGIKRIHAPYLQYYDNQRNNNAPFPVEEEQILEQFGSGVIVNSDKGYLLTNAHIVNELDEIRVYLNDKRKYPAKLIGIDKASDLALLQIEAKNLQAVKFADSDKLRVGDYVVAIGSPYGFRQTVTSGIVSALGRSDFKFDGYFDFIQTDAALNFGNSGGGLFNLSGELVGLNTAIIAPAAGGNVGLGFAIPTNMARSILQQLVNEGHVNRGPLGVRVQSLTPELAIGFAIEKANGAIIIDVISNTPAEKIDLQIGDVITAVDGKEIKDSTHLRNVISLVPAGNTIQVQLVRSGKLLIKKVTINDPIEMLTKGKEIFSGLAGAGLENSPKSFPIRGVAIAYIKRGSLANLSELHEGDIIVGANLRKIKDIKSLRKAAMLNKKILLLQVTRDKMTFFVGIKANSNKLSK